jgi:uncharacterized membrane-anchored protein
MWTIFKFERKGKGNKKYNKIKNEKTNKKQTKRKKEKTETETENKNESENENENENEKRKKAKMGQTQYPTNAYQAPTWSVYQTGHARWSIGLRVLSRGGLGKTVCVFLPMRISGRPDVLNLGWNTATWSSA